MDAKSDKYNIENIPDKLWDAIPADLKKSVDEDIDQKIQGKSILKKEKTEKVNNRNDIA